MSRPRVGVATIARGRHEHLARQHESLAAGSVRPDAYVVAAMDDPDIATSVVGDLTREVVAVGTTPLGLPLAAARNTAVAALLDRDVDVVVCLDVDCLAGPDVVAAYAAAALDRPDVLWSGPVTYLPPGRHALADLASLDDPHPARPAPRPGEVLLGGDRDLFWSLSFALSADAWHAVGGFCEDYVGYGGEDTDFGRLAGDAGVELGWVGSARAYHQHHPVSSPPVEHVDDILRNGRLFHERWGTWPMQGWLERLAEQGVVRRDGDGWVRTLTPAC